MDLVRLSAPLALAALVGCAGAPKHATPARSDVRFDELSGDVWSFERRVSGRAPRGCVTVEIKRGPLLLRVPVRDGRFSGVVPLSPGENVVGAFCADPAVPSSDARVVYRVRLPATPRALARFVTTGGTITIDGAASAPNEGTDLPLASYRWSDDPENPAPLRTADGRALGGVRARRVELETPASDGEYVVWLTVTDAAGRRDRAGVSFIVVGGAARGLDRSREPPAWMEHAVFYGAASVPDEARLRTLAELGVTALGVGPVGEEEDARLRALAERAHQLGLRVLLEVAPSQPPRQHPYVLHASRYGSSSPYRGFFEVPAARLDYDDPDVRRWTIETLAARVRALDLDGLRIVDGASPLAERAPRLVAELREELSRVDPRVVLFADPGERSGGFDATPGGPRAWRDALSGGFDAGALHTALSTSGGGAVLRAIEPSGSRIAPRLLSALVFTAPGIPSLFERDGPLALGSERFAQWRELARLRAREPALRSGRYVPLAAGGRRVYAFARIRDGARPIVVVLAWSGSPSVARIRLGPEVALRLDGLAAEPILGAGAPPRLTRGALVVPLGPHDARAFAFE